MGRQTFASTRMIELPPPNAHGGISLARAIRQRRSVRNFAERTLTWGDIGQLVWAAQGVTNDAAGLRTAPSAGALYPLELDVVTPHGVFRYQPTTHTLRQRITGDVRAELAHAAYEQRWLTETSCVFSVVAIVERTARKYGARAERYVQLEAGHVAQNILLMAVGLGLSGTPVGAFNDNAVARTLGLDKGETPLYLVPVGLPSPRLT
jgi:SagB-type dehydrogenase family enzyme